MNGDLYASNITARWNATLPSCMNHFLSTNNTLETSVDYNVSNTTEITIVNNLAGLSNQSFWGFFVLTNCSVGTNTNSSLNISAVLL